MAALRGHRWRRRSPHRLVSIVPSFPIWRYLQSVLGSIVPCEGCSMLYPTRSRPLPSMSNRDRCCWWTMGDDYYPDCGFLTVWGSAMTKMHLTARLRYSVVFEDFEPNVSQYHSSHRDLESELHIQCQRNYDPRMSPMRMQIYYR